MRNEQGHRCIGHITIEVSNAETAVLYISTKIKEKREFPGVLAQPVDKVMVLFLLDYVFSGSLLERNLEVLLNRIGASKVVQ